MAGNNDRKYTYISVYNIQDGFNKDVMASPDDNVLFEKKERYAIQNVCKTKKVTAYFFCYSRVYKPYTFLNRLEESFSKL